MSKTCTLCPLSLGCLSPVLQGRIEKCEVLIICDQPDSRADFEGVPFQNPLKSLVHGLLQKACLSGYCTTYAVKCASDKKGTPLNVSSIHACRVYLKEDIHAASPDYILLMGDCSLRSVTGKSGVKNNRGKALSALPSFETNAIVYATYGLEYIAKNPIVERTVVSDMMLCKQQKKDVIEWSYWYA